MYQDPSHVPNNSYFGMKHSNSQIISACLKPNWRQICTHIPHTPPPYWLYAVIKQLWKSSISQISTWSAWEIGVHTALLVASAIASSAVFHSMLCKPYPKITYTCPQSLSYFPHIQIYVVSGTKMIIAVLSTFTNVLHLTHHSCSRSSNTLWSASFSATSAALSA